jgi:hypothetical protein
VHRAERHGGRRWLSGFSVRRLQLIVFDVTGSPIAAQGVPGFCRPVDVSGIP